MSAGSRQPADTRKQWVTDAIRENAKGCGAISPDGERACIMPIDHPGVHGWEKGDEGIETIRQALALHYSMALSDERPTAQSRTALEDAGAALAAVSAELAELRQSVKTLVKEDGVVVSRQAAELAELREALEQAHARFTMIEDEGEISGDEDRPSLARTIGLMAGIAERGKVEARAVLSRGATS